MTEIGCQCGNPGVDVVPVPMCIGEGVNCEGMSEIVKTSDGAAGSGWKFAGIGDGAEGGSSGVQVQPVAAGADQERAGR